MNFCLFVQALRVNWEQLLTAIARNINEVENQVGIQLNIHWMNNWKYCEADIMDKSIDNVFCSSFRDWLLIALFDLVLARVTIEDSKGKICFLFSAISIKKSVFPELCLGKVFLYSQILTRDSKGLSEEQMKEFRNSFNFFDKVCHTLILER